MSSPYRDSVLRDGRPSLLSRSLSAVWGWMRYMFRWAFKFTAITVALVLVCGLGFGVYKAYKSIQQSWEISNREAARHQRATAPVVRTLRVSRIGWSCSDEWFEMYWREGYHMVAFHRPPWYRTSRGGNGLTAQCHDALPRNFELYHRRIIKYRVFYRISGREISGAWNSTPPQSSVIGKCMRVTLDHAMTRVLYIEGDAFPCPANI